MAGTVAGAAPTKWFDATTTRAKAAFSVFKEGPSAQTYIQKKWFLMFAFFLIESLLVSRTYSIFAQWKTE